MSAAPARLKKRSEFLAVAAANRRWTTPGLVLQARSHQKNNRSHQKNNTVPDESLTDLDRLQASLRIGFTATKKIGNAVKRNRARRRLRAAVSEVLSGINTKPADIVVVARQGTIARPYAELKADLLAALRRLGITQ